MHSLDIIHGNVKMVHLFISYTATACSLFSRGMSWSTTTVSLASVAWDPPSRSHSRLVGRMWTQRGCSVGSLQNSSLHMRSGSSTHAPPRQRTCLRSVCLPGRWVVSSCLLISRYSSVVSVPGPRREAPVCRKDRGCSNLLGVPERPAIAASSS